MSKGLGRRTSENGQTNAQRFRYCVCCYWLLATIGSINDPYTHPYLSLTSNHIAVIAFQIVLCLIVECVGISIIWCAIFGWILVEVACGRGIGGAASNDTEPDRQAETSNTSPTCVGYGNLSSRCSCIAVVASTILCVDLAAIVYYAVTAPAITTVAHICAILMGVILEVVAVRGCSIGCSRRRFFNWEVSSSPPAESSTTPLLDNKKGERE